MADTMTEALAASSERTRAMAAVVAARRWASKTEEAEGPDLQLPIT